MGGLVQDQPAPEVVARQLRLLLPLGDVGLDQVEARRGDGLPAHQLGVELAQDTVAEERQHAPRIAVDRGLTSVGQPGPRDAGFSDHRIEDPADDLHVEVDPLDPAQGLEGRDLEGRPADHVEERLPHVGGQRRVAVGQAVALGRLHRPVLPEAATGVAADRVPVDDRGLAAQGAGRLHDRGGGDAGEDSEDYATRDLGFHGPTVPLPISLPSGEGPSRFAMQGRYQSKGDAWLRLKSTLHFSQRNTICMARRPMALASRPQTGQDAVSSM